jgi:hypothetical protein
MGPPMCRGWAGGLQGARACISRRRLHLHLLGCWACEARLRLPGRAGRPDAGPGAGRSPSPAPPPPRHPPTHPHLSLHTCSPRAGDRGLQDPHLGQAGQGHPGQHLWRHHEVRRHRVRHRQRGQAGARCFAGAAAGSSSAAAPGPAAGTPPPSRPSGGTRSSPACVRAQRRCGWRQPCDPAPLPPALPIPLEHTRTCRWGSTCR